MMTEQTKRYGETQMIEEKENRQKLSNGYWLCHDRYCWWICKESDEVNKKTGKKNKRVTLRRVSGYAPTVADAFESLSVRVQREIEAKSITMLIKEEKALKSLVTQLAEDIRSLK